MTNWIYNNEIVTEAPIGAFGFIYKIELLVDIPGYSKSKIYIGKKQLSSTRRVRLTKKDKLLAPTRKQFKQVTKESDWKSYWSSCKEIHELIKIHGTEIFKREIICFTKDKYTHGFQEIEEMIRHNVTRVDSFNGCLGRYYFSKLNLS